MGPWGGGGGVACLTEPGMNSREGVEVYREGCRLWLCFDRIIT